ncbi:wax ester/triacylglycerol synthase family O-acyltransferase [Variovorax sp. J22R115]|uniref:wax ester/triacylglycerol synthase family O-acyltransferase n=1 Tax=Variovorax sp. J22R115 TaxID=3053509 RepID=UPI0025767FD5|nr:wax ester/triacylglycerol synthase family O-acyltransferase [Variovorax sp. J22R115]MDM0047410.1 wax ester/triacylglycerol synthase family O-acyltransferase [Variovorax sp. J22R115]
MNDKLTGQDAMFLHVEQPHAASHGTMVYIYDQSTLGGKTLGFREIVHHIESRLDASPVLRRRIVQVPFNLGYPFWVDDELFDIDFHVRHFALPKPGDWRQFCIQVSRIHARAIDLSRAPWEMYVIEGLDNIEGIPKGSFAVLSKIHHAAMDGMAAVELTWALHEIQRAAGGREPVVDPAQPVPPQGASLKWLDLMNRAFGDNIMAMSRMAAPLAQVLPRIAMSRLRSLMEPEGRADLTAPQTRFNTDVVASRVWNSVTFDLAEVKQIKSVVPGATVNDALIAVIGGAMRRYLDSKGELPDRSLLTLAPVNTRQEGTEETASGNNVSMLRFPMGTDIADPIARLEAVRGATAESKEMQKAIGAKQLTDIQKFAPPATLGLAGRLAAMTGSGGKGPLVLHNCLVTNVPGPNAPLYMLGAKLIHWGGVGPVTDGMSLIWNPTSYCGKVFISLTSSPNVVPDPEFLADCLRESFEETKAAAAAAAASAAAAAPALEVAVLNDATATKALAGKAAAKKAPAGKQPARKTAAGKALAKKPAAAPVKAIGTKPAAKTKKASAGKTRAAVPAVQ